MFDPNFKNYEESWEKFRTTRWGADQPCAGALVELKRIYFAGGLAAMKMVQEGNGEQGMREMISYQQRTKQHEQAQQAESN